MSSERSLRANRPSKRKLEDVEQDEIEAESWIASHEMNVELLNLVKELIQLCKEFRPSSRALKVARESLKEKVEQVFLTDLFETHFAGNLI